MGTAIYISQGSFAPQLRSAQISKIQKICEEQGRIVNRDWFSDEILAIEYTENLAQKFIELYNNNLKYSNKNSSSVAFAMGITDEEPWSYPIDMICNLGRMDAVDIDMDFEHTRREELKQYAIEKYKHVVGISTYTELKTKSIIKALARVFALDENIDSITSKLNDDLDSYLESDDTNVQQFSNRHPELKQYLRALQGHIASSGAHASGVLIANTAMNKIIPVETRVDPEDKQKKKRIKVSAYDMNDAAELGLIKFDFLGLNNLTVIHDCIDMIEERHSIKIDWEHIEPVDRDVLDMLSNASTCGVFQMESSAYRKLLVDMGVDNFEDLVASNALVRPGAFNTVAKNYIARKQGLEKVVYPHELTEPFLKNTYGLYIYQEQIMQMVVVLGGFSWAEADKLRKIIGKKLDVSEFKPWFDKWIAGATRYITEQEAIKIWKDFEHHANYSFNRSHAVAYTYIGYVTAWLKLRYPIEYMYALLKTEESDAKRMTYLLEAYRLGINILLPDIHASMGSMSIENDSLRFGIADIRDIGYEAAGEIIKKRPFVNWEDYENRTDSRKCNAKVTVAGIAVDLFRSIEDAPHNDQAEDNYQKYLSYPIALNDVDTLVNTINLEDYDETNGFELVCAVVKSIKRTATYVRIELEDMTGNCTVFGNMDNDLSVGEVTIAIVGEKSMVGYCRVDGLKRRLENKQLTKFESMLFEEPFQRYNILLKLGFDSIQNDKTLVIPLSVKEITTKKKTKMGIVAVLDSTYTVSTLTFFGQQWFDIKNQFTEYKPICIKPRSKSYGKGLTVYSDGIMDAEKILNMKRVHFE